MLKPPASAIDEVRANVPDGVHQFVYGNGDAYEGNFKDGQRHGDGTVSTNSRRFRMLASWLFIRTG